MAARGGKATAGNGGCWKNHHDDIAEAQTNSHRRPWSIGYPQGLTRQGWAAPKVAGLSDLGAGLLTGKRTVRSAYWGMSESSGHRSCRCGAVYDRSEHMVAEREISSFECAVCGATIENWNSAWVPRYQFIARPARTPKDKTNSKPS